LVDVESETSAHAKLSTFIPSTGFVEVVIDGFF